MNEYDSKRMGDIMSPLGYDLCDEPSDADLVVLNTCHIREKAEEKVYSDLGRMREHKESLKKSGKKMIIAVAGCVGQAEGGEIFKRAPYVDIVVGPQSYQTLPDLVSNIKRQQGHQINLDFVNDKFDLLPEEASKQGASAILSVQEGCDKFCTFCVVPYTRGAEYSRDVAKIFREANELVAKGALEITLLGQNVNAYHGTALDGNSWNLGKLIFHLAKIDGLERIRYSTSHPRDMHEDLFKAHAELDKLMPFLNLPVQSGSNKILKKMNRKHTREAYLKSISRLKKARPDMEFSSDFIIGFPGETDDDFKQTLDLAMEVNFIQAYSFKYSERPGTPAAEMTDKVPEDIKNERLQIFQAQINKQQLEYNQKTIGKIVPVLLDKKGKFAGQLLGKSAHMQSVYVSNVSEELSGTIANVKISTAKQNGIGGELA